MSSVTNTVQQILEAVSDIKGESSTNVDAIRIRFVARAVNNFANRRFWLIHLKRNSTVTADGVNQDYTIGDSTYTMRKNGLAEVYVGGLTEDKRYELVDFMKYQNLINQNPTGQYVYEWYDQANDLWKLHLSKLPDNGTTIYYSHFYIPIDVTSTSSTVICYDMDYIISSVLGFVYQSEEDPETAAMYKNEAEQTMKAMEGLEEAPAHNQLKTMSPYQSGTRDRGYGTY